MPKGLFYGGETKYYLKNLSYAWYLISILSYQIKGLYNLYNT